MNYIDIILIIPIIWAVYRGFTDGVIVQMGGILGILLGVWMAYKFGDQAAEFFKIGKDFAKTGGFIIVLVVVIFVVWTLGRVLRSTVKAVGLGAFDKIGGVFLSLLKVVLACGLVIMLFEMGNNRYGWIKQSTLKGSILYTPICATTDVAFPYLVDLKKRVTDPDKGLFGGKNNDEK